MGHKVNKLLSKGHSLQSYCPSQTQPAFIQGLVSQVSPGCGTSPNCLGVQISNRLVCNIVKVEERLNLFKDCLGLNVNLES